MFPTQCTWKISSEKKYIKVLYLLQKKLRKINCNLFGSKATVLESGSRNKTFMILELQDAKQPIFFAVPLFFLIFLFRSSPMFATHYTDERRCKDKRYVILYNWRFRGKNTTGRRLLLKSEKRSVPSNLPTYTYI